MATLQVKGINDQLYQALSARAKMDNRSICQEVVTIIQQFLSSPCHSAEQATNQFLTLAGSWEDESSTEEIIQNIR